MPAKKYFTADKRQDAIESNLNQVIDVIQEDISGSATRRKYQTFVTGGIGPGVTSSLYQTVYDQDFTLQTANAVMDMTVGLFHDDVNTSGADGHRNNLVTRQTGYSKTSNGQLIFDTKHTMMMREKVSIYRQYAKLLLGDANKPFVLDVDDGKCTLDDANMNPANNTIAEERNVMDACLFINVKRLFARDKIRKETFAMRLYENAPRWWDNIGGSITNEITDGTTSGGWQWDYDIDDGSQNSGSASDYAALANGAPNLFGTETDSSEDGVYIIADIGATQGNLGEVNAGEWAFLKKASDININVGLIFYEAGIVVLNLGGSTQAKGNNWGASAGLTEASRYANDISSSGVPGPKADGGHGQDSAKVAPVFSPKDRINGLIAGMHGAHVQNMNSDWGTTSGNASGKVYVGNVSTALNNEQDDTGPRAHTKARFYPDLLVSASIDDIVDHVGFTRFSSGSLTATAFQNETNINSSIFFCRANASQFNGSTNPTWKDDNDEWILGDTADPYAFITTVLLYDESDKIVAIAKLNRPIEKNNQSELTIRVRLDF